MRGDSLDPANRRPRLEKFVLLRRRSSRGTLDVFLKRVCEAKFVKDPKVRERASDETDRASSRLAATDQSGMSVTVRFSPREMTGLRRTAAVKACGCLLVR